MTTYKYKNTKQKGDEYEIFCLEYFKNNEKYEIDQIYLWKNVPELLLHEVGIINNFNIYRLRRLDNYRQDKKCLNPFRDMGLDIICKQNDEKFILV